MRTLCRVLPLLLPLAYLLACFGLPRAASAQSPNLISNSGFEGSSVWTLSNANCGYSTSYFHGGASSGRAYTGCYFEQTISATSGAQYTLMGWFRLEERTISNGELAVYCGGTLQGRLQPNSTTVSSSAVWTQLTATITIQCTAPLVRFTGNANFYTWADDLSLTMIAQATPTVTPAPTVTPTAPPTTPTAVPSDQNKICYKAAATLKSLLQGGNIPYCWGSNKPNLYQPGLIEPRCPTGSGLDCSGSFIWAYNQVGASWPDMTAQGMYYSFDKVGCTLADLSCWQVGDAVFLGTNKATNAVYHVAMYLGGSSWGDCFNTGTGCVVHDVRNLNIYTADFVGVGRPSTTYGWEPCGSSAPTEPGNGGGSWFDIWSPIRWLADQVKAALQAAAQFIVDGITALFVPSENDWQEIQAQLQPLFLKEPIGTIHDVSTFASDLKVTVAGIDPTEEIGGGMVAAAEGASASSWAGPYWVVLESITLAKVVEATSASIELLADKLGVWTSVIKTVNTILLYVSLVWYFRDEIQLTA